MIDQLLHAVGVCEHWSWYDWLVVTFCSLVGGLFMGVGLVGILMEVGDEGNGSKETTQGS